jgi:hypothetical protein
MPIMFLCSFFWGGGETGISEKKLNRKDNSEYVLTLQKYEFVHILSEFVAIQGTWISEKKTEMITRNVFKLCTYLKASIKVPFRTYLLFAIFLRHNNKCLLLTLVICSVLDNICF